MSRDYDYQYTPDPNFEETRSFLIGDEETKTRASEVPFSLEELQPVPYWKRPLVQMSAVLGIGLPLIWIVTLAFKSGEPQIANAKPVEIDAEKAKLISALEAQEERNRQLELKNAMYEQSIETIATTKSKAKTKLQAQSPKPKVQPEPAPTKRAVQPKPQPTVARRNPQPAPRPAPRRQVRTAPVATAPVVKPQPTPQAKPDPMQQWLAMADQGHYTTSHVAEKPVTSQLVSTEPTVIREASPDTTQPSLLDDSFVKDTLSNTSLLTRSELTARLNTDRLSSRRIVKKKPSSSRPEVTPKTTSSNTDVIDIGSAAKATLESAVVWSAGSSNPRERKYLLRLKEDFENIEGKTVLPKGTRLIAQIQQYSNSGLLAMEITQILHQGQKISVPTGALIVEGKKGSPLKADLKQKGDSDFWTDVASTVAPGVERALDSASDTLVVQNGSVFRSNSNRDPLASGASGIADGINQTINRRLRNNQRESVISYFQLDANQTVYLKAYEDIAF